MNQLSDKSAVPAVSSLSSLLAFGDRLHAGARRLRVLQWFTWGVRILLAIGFAVPGSTKLRGDMFGNLPGEGVTGQFLDTFDRVGYLAEFVGAFQVVAAVLLLIPRTALVGALIYLPTIAGIEVITLTTGFFGTTLTPTITTLMLLGTVYLVCWDWHRVKPLVDPAFDDVLAGAQPPQREAR